MSTCFFIAAGRCGHKSVNCFLVGPANLASLFRYSVLEALHIETIVD